MKLCLAAPSSKSMTQRALIIAALSPRPTRIMRPLVCDDSRHLSNMLTALGCDLLWNTNEIRVIGHKLVAPGDPVFCGNAGTAVRFGACLSLICEGILTIDGDTHMRSRPIGPLGTCLTQLGVNVRFLQKDGCPPLLLERLEPQGQTPTKAAVDTSLSSQYASGLLMVAPKLPQGLTITLKGAPVSRPYLDMTIAMMQAAGADVEVLKNGSIDIKRGGYGGHGGTEGADGRIEVETDWSAAAFLLAAGRLSRLSIELDGLKTAATSLQGDAVFASMLEGMDRGDDNLFDLTDVPDLIAPLTALCLFARRPSKIRGAAHTRIKESDRVAVLCRELSKIGAKMTPHDDGIDIDPLDADTTMAGSVILDPDDDHRMAMTFGIVSLRVPGIDIKNPECVSKSFPQFWRVLDQIRAHAHHRQGDRI